MVNDRLLELLGTQLHRAVSYATPPVRISGGYYAAIYGFELEDPGDGWDGELVLRVMPNVASATKEIVIQRTLAELGFPTPRVLLDGVDEAIGGAFVVMTRAPGSMPLSGLSLKNMTVDQLQQMRLLPIQLADVALRLHAVDAGRVNDALAVAAMTDRLGMTMYLDLVRGAAAAHVPGFAELLDWFDARLPTGATTVVCHGDMHPFNLLIADDGSITVLDWTNANIAPREFDIGFTIAFLTCVPVEVPAAIRPVLAVLTRRLRSRFLGRYRKAAQLDPALLESYEALQYSRCLAEVARSRLHPTGVLVDSHPFEIASLAMTRRLRTITGIDVALPPRRVTNR